MIGQHGLVNDALRQQSDFYRRVGARETKIGLSGLPKCLRWMSHSAPYKASTRTATWRPGDGAMAGAQCRQDLNEARLNFTGPVGDFITECGDQRVTASGFETGRVRLDGMIRSTEGDRIIRVGTHQFHQHRHGRQQTFYVPHHRALLGVRCDHHDGTDHTVPRMLANLCNVAR